MSFFNPTPHALQATDPCLRSFLRARTDAEAGRLMEAVLNKIRPVRNAILKRRFFTPSDEDCRDQNQEDYEDVCICVEIALHLRLTRMRAEYKTRGVIDRPIGDIEGYAATVARNAWKAYLREKKPVFHKVRRYIRDLLNGHTSSDPSRQMAVWEERASSGRSNGVGGFAGWRDANKAAVCSDGLTDLLQDPKAVLPEALENARKHYQLDVSDPLSGNGLMAIFLWLNHPVTLNHLAGLLGAATDRADTPFLSINAGTDIADDRDDFEPILLSSYLQFFWQCVCTKLTRSERAVLLLGGRDPNGVSLIWELEQQDIAGLRTCAAIMELPAETLAEQWDALPLEDRQIAERLKIKIQSVRDRRFDAHRKLKKCLEELLA